MKHLIMFVVSYELVCLLFKWDETLTMDEHFNCFVASYITDNPFKGKCNVEWSIAIPISQKPLVKGLWPHVSTSMSESAFFADPSLYSDVQRPAATKTFVERKFLYGKQFSYRLAWEF